MYSVSLRDAVFTLTFVNDLSVKTTKLRFILVTEPI